MTSTIAIHVVTYRVALTLGILLGAFSMSLYSVAYPSTAELAFAESSKVSGIEGSMVPASCESPNSPGSSPVANPQPSYIDYGSARGYLQPSDWYHVSDYVSNCSCSNGQSNWPVCSPPPSPTVQVYF